MRDFHELKVWEMGQSLALKIYAVTRNFPKDEKFGLTNQIRRAALSIPTNVAEGSGRGSGADLCRFLQIAFASACEVDSLLDMATKL